MIHEKIIKRKDGTQYQIRVSILTSYSNREPDYSFNWVMTKAKGQRKWRDVHDFNGDYVWRGKDMKERKVHALDIYLKFVTKEEINQAYLELWNKLRPEYV